MKHTLISLLLCLSALTQAAAQEIEISTRGVTCTTLEDHDGNTHGSGSFASVSGRLSLDLSRKIDDYGRPTLWNATIRCNYGSLANHGEADALYPNHMLNATVNLTHIRPLRGRWSFMASAGVGVYTTVDEFAARDILCNATLIFIYSLNPNLSIGIGAGLSSTFGVPMLLPLPYLRYTSGGRFEFTVNMIGMATVTAAVQADERLKLRMDLLDVESMSVIRYVDSRTMVYGHSTFQSALRPELSLGSSSRVYLSVGVAWWRTLRTTRRSLGGFFKSFNHNYRSRFNPSLALSVGYACEF